MTAALSLWEAGSPASRQPQRSPQTLEKYRCLRDAVLRLVGRGKRVLEIVGPGGTRLSGLKNQGCQVVALAHGSAGEPEEDALAWQSVLTAERFDAVVAVDVLPQSPNPAALLRALHGCLANGGFLIVSVPNVAHGSVRLALLQGRFPSATHQRFYTRESLFQILEETQFAIGHLERQQAGFDPAAAPADLVAALANDVEARTDQFVVVAYPLPAEHLSFLQDRLRESALATDALGRRELELERKLLDLQEQLARRDTALQQTLRELSIQRDRREFFEARINRIWNSFPVRVLRRMRNLLNRVRG